MSNLVNNKREKWIRHGFWFIAGAFAALAIFKLYTFMNKKLDLTIPSGYDYVIEDHFAKSDTNWATYYVYGDYVLVTKDGEEEKDEPAMIYDGIGSSKLEYNEENTVKMCDSDSCFAYPEILVSIKKFIADKFGREYTGR
ncbi:hypothetical protein IJH15_00445 [Candidatus Saccharibacteria bacterium]|nr:hypothetical protein [Candidatus Saccharibacteria bacterium]MBQ6313545.1 hypothetical protein [Candidatus Saccharibacteria bacterium]